MKGGTRVSSLGQVGGGDLCTRRCQELGLGSQGLPGHPIPSWVASALLLDPADTRTHAPRHTRLPAHTCTHVDTWSLDPEVPGAQRAHVLGAFRGQMGKCWPLACAWIPLQPLAHLPSLYREGDFSSQQGLRSAGGRG